MSCLLSSEDRISGKQITNLKLNEYEKNYFTITVDFYNNTDIC